MGRIARDPDSSNSAEVTESAEGVRTNQEPVALKDEPQIERARDGSCHDQRADVRQAGTSRRQRDAWDDGGGLGQHPPAVRTEPPPRLGVEKDKSQKREYPHSAEQDDGYEISVRRNMRHRP